MKDECNIQVIKLREIENTSISILKIILILDIIKYNRI